MPPPFSRLQATVAVEVRRLEGSGRIWILDLKGLRVWGEFGQGCFFSRPLHQKGVPGPFPTFLCFSIFPFFPQDCPTFSKHKKQCFSTCSNIFPKCSNIERSWENYNNYRCLPTTFFPRNFWKHLKKNRKLS